MTTFERWRAVLVAALALGMASAASASAAGWEMREFEKPDGGKAIGLSVGAKGHPEVRLAIACDQETGARWRSVVVVEPTESSVALGMRGDVRISFGDRTTRDQWRVQTTEAGFRVFTAPESTRLARRLLKEEAGAGTVTVEIHGVAGKPVPLTFPLAGLGAKIAALSAKCADWELETKE